jgi:ADP-heptose:LPS heptosyltransferase
VANHRVLVFRPGALGDTILTVDALVALRLRFPDAEIELIGNGQAGAVLVESGIVERATSFDSADVTGLFAVPARVSPRWASADVAVLWLRHAEPIAQRLRVAGIGHVIAADPPIADSRQHAADQLVTTLAPLGIEQRPPFRTLTVGNVRLEDGGSQPSRTALIHVGSGAARKNWPPDRYAALTRRLVDEGWSATLISGPADTDSVRHVVNELGTMALPVIAPDTALSLARLLAGTPVCIGNDSGVTHLSARLGVSTVAIFGPTDPRQWAPLGPRVAVLHRAPWPTVEEVMRGLVQLLESSQRRQPRVNVDSRPDALARLHSSRG